MRVGRGQCAALFGVDLFYRLNTIHIRLDTGPAARRGPTATLGQSADRT